MGILMVIIGFIAGFCTGIYGYQAYIWDRHDSQFSDAKEEVSTWLEQLQSEEDYLSYAKADEKGVHGKK